MAKKMMMCTSECGPKCFVTMLIAILILAVGLWMIVKGVVNQMALMQWSKILPWYFGGFLLWAIYKKLKLKACATCR